MNALANSQVGELEKFLVFGPPGADGARHVRPLHRAGERRGAPGDPRHAARHPAHELRDARADPDAAVRATRSSTAARGFGSSCWTSCTPTAAGRAPTSACSAVASARRATPPNCSASARRPRWPGRERSTSSAPRSRGSHRCCSATTVEPSNVIGETLRRATAPTRLDDPTFVRALADASRRAAARPTSTAFVADPLASWIETTFGLEEEPGTGRLRRAQPRPIDGADGAADELAELTGRDEIACAEAIRDDADAGLRRCTTPTPGSRSSRSGCTSSSAAARRSTPSLEPEDDRYVTTREQQYVPGDRTKVLLPLAFCRECGQEYYTVRIGHGRQGARGPAAAAQRHDRRRRRARRRVPVRELRRAVADDAEELLEPRARRLARAARRRRARQGELPQAPATCRSAFDPDGTRREDGMRFHFVPTPFRFCLRCGVSHGGRSRSDFGKLMTLGAGGRSSATTILGLAAIRSLRARRVDSNPRAQAPQLHRQPPGRLAPGRSLQRLRRGRPDPLRPVPGRRRRRSGGLDARRARAARVRGARAPDRALRRRPDRPLRRTRRDRPRVPRRARLPALPRPRARLADHRAEPRAVRPARDRLRVARRALRGRGRLGDQASRARRLRRPERRA